MASKELAAQLALCDALRELMYAANALDVHADQRSTYGAISVATLKAIKVTLAGEGYGVRAAARAAERILDEAIDNGESITYNYKLLVDGVIAA